MSRRAGLRRSRRKEGGGRKKGGGEKDTGEIKE